jgi:hypothetical protein
MDLWTFSDLTGSHLVAAVGLHWGGVMGNQSLISEFWEFLKIRKRYWLLPIVLMLSLLGLIIVFTEGSAVAPFIYALF